MIFARYTGLFLLALGIFAALVAATAGPLGPLKDLRHPLLVATLGYLLVSYGERGWFARERIRSALEAKAFPWVVAGLSAFVFCRIKVLEWWAGGISGVDFSHLDYAVWSTVQGRFMEVPIAAGYNSWLNFFGTHYSPILYFHVLARALWDSPLAALTVHALSLAAAVPVLHALATYFVDRSSAALLTLTYVFCGAVAATLQFDWHHESFYPLTIGMLLLGLFRRGRGGTLLACLGAASTLAIKEDAPVYLAPALLWLAILYRRRWKLPVALAAISLLWFVFVMKVAMPWHQPQQTGAPAYLTVWLRYGSSYKEVALGMLTHPHWVFADLFLNPAFYKNLLPWGFLPLASPFGLMALPPALVLATGNGPAHTFGLYYGIVLVPFLFLAAAHVLGKIQRRRRVAAAMLAASVFIGGSFLRFPAPSPEFPRWREAGSLIHRWAPEASEIWVQGGMLPYLPYETTWRRLDRLEQLPPPGSGVVAIYRGLGLGMLELGGAELADRLQALGYREMQREGALSLFR